MDGLCPVLLARRGAARVVAYDRMPQPAKISTVQRRLGLRFEYLYGFELDELAARCGGAFDVVVCGGLLYHAYDPLAALLRVRAMVRTGGILILESACVPGADAAMYFNAGGAIYGAQSNYWFPTVGCLEYLLRYVRLLPADCAFVYEGAACGAKLTLRVAVAARAMDEPQGPASDDWMRIQNDFDSLCNMRGLIDWTRCRSELPPVLHTRQTPGISWNLDPPSVDVVGSVYSSPALEVSDDALVLRLGDLF
jgi:hypothetical protein